MAEAGSSSATLHQHGVVTDASVSYRDTCISDKQAAELATLVGWGAGGRLERKSSAEDEELGVRSQAMGAAHAAVDADACDVEQCKVADGSPAMETIKLVCATEAASAMASGNDADVFQMDTESNDHDSHVEAGPERHGGHEGSSAYDEDTLSDDCLYTQDRIPAATTVYTQAGASNIVNKSLSFSAVPHRSTPNYTSPNRSPSKGAAAFACLCLLAWHVYCGPWLFNGQNVHTTHVYKSNYWHWPFLG